MHTHAVNRSAATWGGGDAFLTSVVDGDPVSSFTLDSLRRSIGVVSQRVELLNASIADNLRLVAPDAGDGELWRVLGEVGLAGEVRGMEAGLRTVVGPAGTRLLGGQAQRLTVARNLPTGVSRTWLRILESESSRFSARGGREA